MRITTTLNELVDAFNQQRDDLIRKYGNPSADSDGKFVIAKDMLPAFNAELQNLLNVQVSLNVSSIPLKSGDA